MNSTDYRFTGASRFFEMTFFEAPDADTGMETPLIVQVENFVSREGVPIPTTTGDGKIVIP